MGEDRVHVVVGAGLAVTMAPRDDGRLELTVDDEGSGFPDGVEVVRRVISGADSSGLGFSIAHKTATESGGGLVVRTSPAGGGRVVVELTTGCARCRRAKQQPMHRKASASHHAGSSCRRR